MVLVSPELVVWVPPPSVCPPSLEPEPPSLEPEPLPFEVVDASLLPELLGPSPPPSDPDPSCEPEPESTPTVLTESPRPSEVDSLPPEEGPS